MLFIFKIRSEVVLQNDKIDCREKVKRAFEGINLHFIISRSNKSLFNSYFIEQNNFSQNFA